MDNSAVMFGFQPLSNVEGKYRSALEGEARYRQQAEPPARPTFDASCLHANTIYAAVSFLAQVARSSLVPRGYTVPYGLIHQHPIHIWQGEQQTPIVFESVGAHSNFLAAIVDLVFSYRYPHCMRGDCAFCTPDGYTYQDIMHAVRLHDLPENVIGDIQDNGSYDKAAKASSEEAYFEGLNVPSVIANVQLQARGLVQMMEMDFPASPAARLLKVADKTAAVLMCLVLDCLGESPMMSPNDKYASERDLVEMAICDYHDPLGLRRASEMWTVDLFNIRRYIDNDDTGFFVALIIMATLMVHGTWYSWREKLYPPAIAG